MTNSEHGTGGLDSRIALTPRTLWAILSVAAVIAGSVGTWLTAGPISVGGTTSGGDGIYTLIAGGLLIPCIFVRRLRLVVLPIAGIAAAISIVDIIYILRGEDNDIFPVSLGWGVVAVAVGSGSLIGWGVAAIAMRTVRAAWTVGLLAVCLAATLTVLGVSGRFDAGKDDTGSSSSTQKPGAIPEIAPVDDSADDAEKLRERAKAWPATWCKLQPGEERDVIRIAMGEPTSALGDTDVWGAYGTTFSAEYDTDLRATALSIDEGKAGCEAMRTSDDPGAAPDAGVDQTHDTGTRTPSDRATGPIARVAGEPDKCVVVHVSTIAPSYASARTDHSVADCENVGGDGIGVFKHTTGGWKSVGGCSSCGEPNAVPGVPADVLEEFATLYANGK